MTDYDLGRARGKITVDVDKRGFRAAEGAMDDLADSTENLGKQFDETTDKLEAQEKQTKKTAKSTDDLSAKEAGLNKRMVEAEKAAEALNKALDDLNDTLLSEGASMDEIEKKTKKVTEARKAQTKADENAKAAAKALSSELDTLTQKFDALPDKKTVEIDVDTKKAEDKLASFNKKMMALKNLKGLGGMAGAGYGPLAKGGAYGSGGGILGGAAGLLGAGGTGASVNTIMGIVQAAGQLSGVLGLIPGVAAGAAFGIGTLKVATQGLGDAMEAAMSGDAEAFAKSLEDLSMSAQELMVGFNAMVPSIKEAGRAVQESFTSGLLDYLKPLAETYMPLITTNMQRVADAANRAIKIFADWALQPAVMSSVNAILTNISNSMGILSNATRPVADAILDIVSVSSDFLPQLSQDIVGIAKEFSSWIHEMRDSGQMAEWIQGGIDAFKQLWGIAKTLGSALGRIFEIWDGVVSGGALGWLEKMVTTFGEWVNSAEGSNALTQFFTSINQAMDALLPVLKPIMDMLVGTFIPMLADLGTSMAPGLQTFFTSLAEAMKNLAPYIVALAPAFNQMLTAMGGALVDIVNGLGPALPGLFQTLADAISQLAPHIPAITAAIVTFATEIMQYLPGIADDVGQILPPLIQFIGVIKNLQTALIAAGTQIIVWLGKIGSGFLEFMNNLVYVWPTQAAAAVKTFMGNLGEQIKGGALVVWDGLKTVSGKIGEWIASLPGKMLDAGRSLIENLMQGIKDRLSSLGDVAKSIVTTITDWLPGSPAKKGPLSGSGWSYKRGQSLAEDFASGIDKSAGEVGTSASQMAQYGADGMSPMSQWVQDMLQITGFSSKLIGIFKDFVDIGLDFAKFVTTDPMTGKSTLTKKWERNVSDQDLAKRKADDAFQKQWDDAHKKPDKVDTSNPAQRQGSLANDVPIIVNPDGTISSPDPEWDKLIKRESGGRNIPQGNIGDINNKNGDLAKGYFQITDATWKQYGGGKYTTNAMDATPQQQAEIAANIFRARGGQPWGAVSGGGREDPKKLLAGLGTLPPGGTIPVRPGGGRLSPQDSGGKQSQQAARDVAGLLSDMFPQLQTIGGARPDSMPYHREGRALDVMIPNYNTKEGKALGDRIMNWAQQNAEAIGLEDTIWQDFWTPAGGGEGHSLNRASQGDTAGHMDHVHLTFKNGASVDLAMDRPKVEGTPWAPPGTGDARSQAIADRRAINAAPAQPTPGSGLGADLKPPDYVNGPGIPQDQMVVGPDGRLQVADQANEDSLTMDEAMLNELRTHDATLDEAIRVGQDPNSTDEQVADSLSTIDKNIAAIAGTDTPQARAQLSALEGVQSDIAGKRGFGEAQSPIDQAGKMASGAAGIAQDVVDIIDGVIKSIGAASEISSTLVRGIKNTEDIYNLIDQFQVFIDLAAKIAGTVSDVAGFAAGFAGAGGPFGSAAGSAIQGVSAIAGMVQAALQAINTAIDLGQEAYRIASKYFAQFLGHLIGGAEGSLLGDIKFLLDEQTGQLMAWSDENPEDKRTHNVPGWMQSNVDKKRGEKIRDLNVYVGPGSDPGETMNAAMWMVTSDQGGVFTSDY